MDFSISSLELVLPAAGGLEMLPHGVRQREVHAELDVPLAELLEALRAERPGQRLDCEGLAARRGRVCTAGQVALLALLDVGYRDRVSLQSLRAEHVDASVAREMPARTLCA